MTGSSSILYEPENKDSLVDRGSDTPPIFVDVDLASGFYIVEGSTMLWDELYAFQGLDADDIKNPYCVAVYIACLEKFGLLDGL